MPFGFAISHIGKTTALRQALKAKFVLFMQARGFALYPTGNGGSTRHWFRQDQTLIAALFSGNRLYPPEETVNKLMQLYPELEDYFSTREPGAHCKTHVSAWSQNAS